MNYRAFFRGTILMSVALTILAGWLGRATRGALPSPLREYALAEPPLPGWLVAVGGVMILLTIITAVGLYRFWPPARPLYVASMALSFVIAPMVPPVVQTALASTVQSLGLLVAGLMVGLMYFSPVASEFRRAKT